MARGMGPISSYESALKVTYGNVGGQKNFFVCGGLSSELLKFFLTKSELRLSFFPIYTADYAQDLKSWFRLFIVISSEPALTAVVTMLDIYNNNVNYALHGRQLVMAEITQC